jgi:hypothetical protein
MTKSTEELAVESLFYRSAGRTVQMNTDAYNNITVSPTDANFNELKEGLQKMGFGVFPITNHKGRGPTGKAVSIGFDQQSDGQYRIAAAYVTYQNPDDTYRIGPVLKLNYTPEEIQQKRDELTKQYSDLFNKYAGKEIQVVKGQYNRLEAAPSDTVAAELTKDIRAIDQSPLIMIEGNIYPGSLPSATVPVFVKKDPDNKYRINQVGIGTNAFKR